MKNPKPIPIPVAARCSAPSFVNVITHKTRPYARWLDHASALLHCLRSPAPGSSRALDALAQDWLAATPERQESTARFIIAPRFLVPDVFARACAIKTKAADRKAAQLVSDNLESLAGLIAVDSFIGAEGDFCQSLTLRGSEGVNSLLLLLSRNYSRVQGMWNGVQFAKRIAPVVASRSTPEAVATLVNEITAACKARLSRFETSRPGVTLDDLMIPPAAASSPSPRGR